MGLFVGLGLFAFASLAAAWAHVRRVRPGLPPASGPAVTRRSLRTYVAGDGVIVKAPPGVSYGALRGTVVLVRREDYCNEYLVEVSLYGRAWYRGDELAPAED